MRRRHPYHLSRSVGIAPYRLAGQRAAFKHERRFRHAGTHKLFTHIPLLTQIPPDIHNRRRSAAGQNQRRVREMPTGFVVVAFCDLRHHFSLISLLQFLTNDC